jgi:hypothetical protein
MGHTVPTGVQLNVDIKNSGGTSQWNGAGNTAQAGVAGLGELDTIVFETGFDLSSLPVDDYTIEILLEHAGTDDVITNDTVIRTFSITDNVMGHYSNDPDFFYYTSPGYDGTAPEEFQMGQAYEITTDVELHGIDFYVASGFSGVTGSTPDNEINVNVYTWDFQSDPSWITSRKFKIESSMFDTWATLNFNQPLNGTAGPVNLTAGTVYVVSVENLAGSVLWSIGNPEDVDFSSRQYGDFYQGGPGWGSNARDLALDLNFDASLSTGVEAGNDFGVTQNFPNPFDNTSVINYTLNENANVQVEFVDLAGKVVRSLNEGTQAAGTYSIEIDANDFAEGVYFYTFTIGEKQVTKRMVVTK